MIVLDVETTGLNANKCSIIEIGAIDFNNPSNQFYKRCRVRDNTEINENSLKVNGYSKEELFDKSYISEAGLILEFIKWIKKIDNRTIAGQNVNFDLNFLNATTKREKINWDFGRRVVDLHSIAYSHFLQKNKYLKLKKSYSAINGDLIMEYVGIPKEPLPHKGINGAKYESEAFSRLIYNKPLFDEFKKFRMP